MLTSHFGPITRGVLNAALNSSFSYGFAKLTEEDSPRSIAIIVAIDTTFRIAAKHLFDHVFGAKVDSPRNMVHFSFLLVTGLIQLMSAYVADRYFRARSKSQISLFGYIALSWKVNIMVKDLAFTSRLIKM